MNQDAELGFLMCGVTLKVNFSISKTVSHGQLNTRVVHAAHQLEEVLNSRVAILVCALLEALRWRTK